MFANTKKTKNNFQPLDVQSSNKIQKDKWVGQGPAQLIHINFQQNLENW